MHARKRASARESQEIRRRFLRRASLLLTTYWRCAVLRWLCLVSGLLAERWVRKSDVREPGE